MSEPFGLGRMKPGSEAKLSIGGADFSGCLVVERELIGGPLDGETRKVAQSRVIHEERGAVYRRTRTARHGFVLEHDSFTDT